MENVWEMEMAVQCFPVIHDRSHGNYTRSGILNGDGLRRRERRKRCHLRSQRVSPLTTTAMCISEHTNF
jgi:hypothetical protein